jgi:death-on-curing family protein
MQKDSKNEQAKGKIVIYRGSSGPTVEVKVFNESVWLSLNQIADLFGTQKAAISKHIKNIIDSAELSQKATVSKMETVQKEGNREVRRAIEFYNLDMIIAVGYRVNSSRATQFRIWATEHLRNYILKGYLVDRKRLTRSQAKITELESANKIFRNALNSRHLTDKEKGLLKIITDYTDTWVLLNKYDKGELEVEGVSKKQPRALNYESVLDAVARLKQRLIKEKEATDIFGKETGHKLEAVLGSIEQSFGKQAIYKSIEERAAHLLYFVIKDHPFVDGNKRIGSLLFLLYLIENNHFFNKRGERKIDDATMTALALLVAASDPKQKDMMVKLIVNLIK